VRVQGLAPKPYSWESSSSSASSGCSPASSTPRTNFSAGISTFTRSSISSGVGWCWLRGTGQAYLWPPIHPDARARWNDVNRMLSSTSSQSFSSNASLVLATAVTLTLLLNTILLRRRRGRTVAPPRPPATAAEIHLDGSRFDRLCLNAARSIEAAVAVTAALTILSIQLLHRGVAILTLTGFYLAASSLGVALIGSLLVLSTPMKVERRKEARDAALNSPGTGSRTTLIHLRNEAWVGLIGRLFAIVVVVLLLVASIICMSDGQLGSPDPNRPIIHLQCSLAREALECQS
jgi:hypothetical protein